MMNDRQLISCFRFPIFIEIRIDKDYQQDEVQNTLNNKLPILSLYKNVLGSLGNMAISAISYLLGRLRYKLQNVPFYKNQNMLDGFEL